MRFMELGEDGRFRYPALVFLGLTVLMRGLLIGLLISVVALVIVAGAVARHVRRQRRISPDGAAIEMPDAEIGLIHSEDSKGRTE